MGGAASSNKVHRFENTGISSTRTSEVDRDPVTSSTAAIHDVLGCSANTDQETFTIPGLVEADDEENGQESIRKKKRRRANVPANAGNTQYSIVKQVLEDSGYIINRSMTSYLIWSDYPVPPERIAELQPYQRINHFPDMAELGRKDLFSRNIAKMARNHPEEFNFVPKTWIFPHDARKFVRYARTLRERKTFIVKPANGSQGCGISLYHDPFQIPVLKTEHVVQEYVSNPMLVDGYKCDMRIYVLVTSCDPLRIYVYKEGLLRLGTEKYANTDRNLKNVFAHLTNYAVNKNSANYTKGEDFSTGSKRSLTFYTEYLRAKNYDVDKLWANINDIIVKTLIIAEPHLLHSYRAYRPGLSAANSSVCFQILGFDVLVDRTLKPWVLEVNLSPSLDTKERIDQVVKAGMLGDAFHLLNIRESDRSRNRAFQKAESERRLQKHSSRIKKGWRKSSVDCRAIEKERRELEKLLEKIKREEQMADYEKENIGGYTRLFPSKDKAKQEKYAELLNEAFTLIPLSGASQNLQKEIELTYGNRLRESDIQKQISKCDAAEQKILSQVDTAADRKG